MTFIFFFFPKKINLGISCELSANKVIFLKKKKKKKIKISSAAFVISALRVKWAKTDNFLNKENYW